MSLRNQLWIAVAVLVSLSFLFGFLVSGHSARNYYQEQLALKNNDNANSLALSLSQLGDDPTLLELAISGQFDVGHYRRIELIGESNQTIVSRRYDGATDQVPAWFEGLMGFDVPAGIAQVQQGWTPLGTLYVESHTGYAMTALWQSTVRLFLWFFAIAVGCGMLGSFLLGRISRPLDTVVEQAEAIGSRRFLKGDEPKTREFGRLVRAMNQLSERVKVMLSDESARLEELRQSSQIDGLTGVANRKHFMNALESSVLSSQNEHSAVLMLRIRDLAGMNNRMGRSVTDQWIVDQVRGLEEIFNTNRQLLDSFLIGRLNGSEIAVLINETEFLNDIAGKVSDYLAKTCEHDTQLVFPFALAGSYCVSEEKVSDIMSRLDDLLVRSEMNHLAEFAFPDSNDAVSLFSNPDEWRRALARAIEDDQISIISYPTLDSEGNLIHQELMMQLALGGKIYSAGRVIAWARRVNLLSRLDLAVVKHASERLLAKPEPIAINLSEDSLLDSEVYIEITERLRHLPQDLVGLISFEVNERVAAEHSELFGLFSSSIHGVGARVGLQQVSSAVASLQGLEQFGLDYLKVDSVLIHTGNQSETKVLLERLCSLGRSLGMTMIAEGVETPLQLEHAFAAGLQGATGPQIQFYQD